MKQKIMGLVCLVSMNSMAEQYCLNSGIETTPSTDFVELSDDDILHSPTNLVWKRCAEGQTWDGTNCTGEAQKYTWQQALQLALSANETVQAGWRLPRQGLRLRRMWLLPARALCTRRRLLTTTLDGSATIDESRVLAHV